MLPCQRATGYLVLAVTLFQWPSRSVLRAETLQKPLQQLPFDPSQAGDVDPPSLSSTEEKSATDLAAKLLLLGELVSLENDVSETKKKRSFSGFGLPLDRLSAASVDQKVKQRKMVEPPKRRFGLPLDRIGVNRLNNSRDLPALLDVVSRRVSASQNSSMSSGLLSLQIKNRSSKKCDPPPSAVNRP